MRIQVVQAPLDQQEVAGLPPSSDEGETCFLDNDMQYGGAGLVLLLFSVGFFSRGYLSNFDAARCRLGVGGLGA